jgi:hypothetical protein
VLETELRRLAVHLDLDQSAVSDLLTQVDVVDPTLVTNDARLVAAARSRACPSGRRPR